MAQARLIEVRKLSEIPLYPALPRNIEKIRTLYLRELDSGDERHVSDGNGDWVAGARFSPDGSHLAYVEVEGHDQPRFTGGRTVMVDVTFAGQAVVLAEGASAVGWPVGWLDGETPILERLDAEGHLGLWVAGESSEPSDLLLGTLAGVLSPTTTSVTTILNPTETPTATPVLTDMDVREWSSTSLDGAWTADGLAAFPKEGEEHYYTQLKIARADGTLTWVVVDVWSPLALGYTTPQPLYWSQDGRYLYFTNRPVPDGCALFVNGSDLQRVDLTDGSVTEIVPHVGFWLSLSPDETTLAYIGYGDRGLVLRDLATGQERATQVNAEAEDSQMGHIVWSPDGTALMLTVAINPCSPAEQRANSIVRVEVETSSQTRLICQDSRLFTTAAWPTPERALLKDKDGNDWWMNTATDDVTPSG